MLRTLALLRDEAAVLDAAVDAALAGATLERRSLARCRPRSRGWRCSGSPTTRRAAARRARRARRRDPRARGRRGHRRARPPRRPARRRRVRARCGSSRARPTAAPAAAALADPRPRRVRRRRADVRARDASAIADGTLAADALAPALEVRAWRPGDRMRPLGLGGSSSLQDLFTDRKVPRERARTAAGRGLRRRDRLGARAWPRASASASDRDTRERVRLAWRLDSAAPMSEADRRDPRPGGRPAAPHPGRWRRRSSRDYEGKDLLLIGVLKGAFLFLADLMRHLDVGCEVDFMAVASYGSSTESSRRRADPQGPRRAAGGPPRPDRRGHRRLRADAAVPDAHAGGAAARPRWRSARC